MAYLGNQPALSYTSFAKQDFTTSATTSYTLDHPVTNENEIALFINFVRQEPTTAYTASGTSLTLTSATSASDDMYCVFLGKAVQTVNPPSGSVGASQIADSSIALGKLSATGTKDSTTFLRGDNTFASAGGNNTPNFLAYRSSSFSVDSGTQTQIIFNAEVYDTDNAFNTSTGEFTVPSGKGGKYFIFLGARKLNFSGSRFYMQLRVNGSNYLTMENSYSGNSYVGVNGSTVRDLSAGDVISADVYQNSGGTESLVGDTAAASTYIGGYKLIT